MLIAASAANADAPAGYAVVTTTDYGQALFAQKPDLAGYFDARPVVKGAYEDSKTHQSGGAIFTATLKGQPMKGVISCKLLDKGAAITVIYCRIDTPQAEWAKLSAEPDAPANPSASAAPDASAGGSPQVYQFPDGSGTISLAPGWQTQAPSAIGPIAIKGPADQNVFIGSSVTVQTPESPMLRMLQQNQDRIRQSGGTPPLLLVAEFTDPVQAMKDLTAQLSQFSQANGGPSVNIDQIISQQDTPTILRNGKAAIVSWKCTRTLNGVSKQYQGSQKIQIAPIGQGASWMYLTTGFTTPVETFDQDKVAIFAMIRSLNVNQQAAEQIMQQRQQQQMSAIQQQGAASSAALKANADAFQQQQDQRFADNQERQAETQAGYDQHNQQFQSDELAKARNKDNQVEQILGYRTVYDTQTGLSTTADLSDVTSVVNSLNQAALDPNRFVQIPLRDQQDPGPGQ